MEKSGTRSKCAAAAAASSSSASTSSTPPLVALLAVAVAFSLAAASTALAARTHGEVSRLDVPCLSKLNALWAAHYPDVNATSGGGGGSEPVPSLCRSILDQALQGKANDRCPDERAVVECFNEAPEAWSGFVSQCALFLGTATDPAADGTVATGGARHLLAGEGEGEGEGGGSSLVGQGCFPNFKTPRDFDAWLKGDFKETHDYGRASPVALTSAAVFTVLLFSMAAF